MSAAAAEYRIIREPAPPAPPPYAFSAPMAADAPPTAGDRIQAVARGAGAAAVGAKDAVAQLITGPMPDVNLFTEPLDPGADYSLKERLQIVLESCRPWGEFADLMAFGMPPASEVKLRIGHNAETFFYNYVVLGMVMLALHAVFHPMRAFLLAGTVLIGVLMYILYPEDYVLSDKVTITSMVKHVIMALVTVLVLTAGQVFALLFWVVVSFLPIALLHAFLREHAASGVSTI